MLTRQVLLFVAGCVFAALLMPARFDGLQGRAAQGLVLWLSFYPFAASTGLGVKRYWLLLFAALPVALLADATSGTPRTVLQSVTLVVLAIAVVGVVVQHVVGRRARV